MGGCNQSASKPAEDPNAHEKAINHVEYQFDAHIIKFADSNTPPLTFNHPDPNNIQNFIVPSQQTQRDLYQFDKINKAQPGVFIDSQFKASTISITGNAERFKIAQECAWRRPQDFLQDQQAQLFVDEIAPEDIKQGSLSALAENPIMIKRLFATSEYQSNGLHCIWLCHNGEWDQVVIDDFFPILKSTNKPAFSDTHGPEIWALFLEKAYAKIYGSYEKIESGFPGHALRDLTGAPYETWIRGELSTAEVMKLWGLIKFNLKRGYVLTASSAASLKGEIESKDTNGIISNHCYSILYCTEVVGSDNKPDKILQLRNPWGHCEWNGDWSDESDKWTPELKQQLNLQDKDDGIFWININDFAAKYEQVAVCKLHPNYKYTSWKTQGSLSDNRTKKVLLIRVHQKSHGFITFSEVDQREFTKTSNEGKYCYSFSRIALGKIDPETLKVSIFIGDSNDSDRDSTIENVFEPGDYALYFEQDWKQELRRDITLSAYAETAFEFQEVNVTDEQKDQILNELIAVCDQPKEKTKVYENSRIKKVTGVMAGYLYFQYINKSEDCTLEETVKMKNRKYLEICEPFTNSDQFRVVVAPNTNILVKFRVQSEGEGNYSYSSSTQYQISEPVPQQGQ